MSKPKMSWWWLLGIGWILWIGSLVMLVHTSDSKYETAIQQGLIDRECYEFAYGSLYANSRYMQCIETKQVRATEALSQ